MHWPDGIMNFWRDDGLKWEPNPERTPMKPVIAIAIAGAFAITGLSAGITSASAAQQSLQKSPMTDVSSAKKKSNHVWSYNGYRYNGYRHGWYGPSYRRSYAADPSFDPSGRPYRPTVNSPCTVDLGYGRFASCDR